MRIDKLCLQNFRNFKKLELSLNPKMNIIVGNNGSGKTALLLGALTGASAFFLGIDGVSARSIQSEDVRHLTVENGQILQQEDQYPVEVYCEGEVDGRPCNWKRTLNGAEKNTTYGEAASIRKIAAELQDRIRKLDGANAQETATLPLIAYYGTGRLWAQKKAKRENRQRPGSRLEGYEDCIAEQATEKQLLDWFSSMTLLVHQEGEIPQYTAVQKALEQCFADLVDHDKSQAVRVEYRQRYASIVVEYTNPEGVREMHPIWEMSDGYRSVLNMVADIAHRMAVLNPHLGSEAMKTPGVIVIDEVELHLHPGWQKRILKDLAKVFPCIQFVVSTHSPEVITSYKEASLILLHHSGKAETYDSAYGKDTNTVLNCILNVKERPNEIAELFDKFSLCLHREEYAQAKLILEELEQILGRDDPSVYDARTSLEIEQMEWDDAVD